MLVQDTTFLNDGTAPSKAGMGTMKVKKREAYLLHPPVALARKRKPIEAQEDRREEIAVPRMMARGQTYALKVRGNSMVDDGILDNDLVVLRAQATVEDGEVAVALLEDGSTTLKRVYRDGKRVRLEPANAAMAPIVVDHVTIQGKVVGLIRTYR